MATWTMAMARVWSIGASADTTMSPVATSFHSRIGSTSGTGGPAAESEAAAETKTAAAGQTRIARVARVPPGSGVDMSINLLVHNTIGRGGSAVLWIG